MSKKQKRVMSVTEAVGDTSGFNETAPKFDKKRKATMFASLAGIVVLLVLAIIMFTTPIKAEFKFQDNASKSERYQVSRTDGLLIDAPTDPKRTFYDFAGWYLTPDCKGEGLFNNDEDKSLLEYKFNTSVKISLYAKWTATEFKVNYDVKGNANFNTSRVESLKEQNLELNPATYSVKHTLLDYERNEYADYLRELNPEKYVNASNAQTALLEQIEFYSNEAQKASITLKEISVSGWTFIGWFDDEGNEVTSLDKLSPKEINLTARWEQN
ncbi:MAG: InlB B-repeat-containing protein [Bacilli bacterium]|nr:InlB B-repeat-containing protein [Bacilli bacterium]